MSNARDRNDAVHPRRSAAAASKKQPSPARFGSTNPCPVPLQCQFPRSGWRTPRASRTGVGLPKGAFWGKTTDALGSTNLCKS